MSIEEIKEIILSVLAPVGGVAGLVAIITSIAKIISAAKSGKALSQYSAALDRLKGEIIEQMHESLNCSLDVDISAKLNAVLENLEAQYVSKAQEIDEKLEVMRKLSVEMTQLMSTSRKITEEKRLELSALIDQANSLVVAPVRESKPKLTVALGGGAKDKKTAETPQEVTRKIIV